MSTRDIVNSEGAVIGQLTLPDSTSEEHWTSALSAYAQPAVIPSVTPRQIRQAMILSGIAVATIESAINSMPEPYSSLARAEWEYSVSFERNRPLVVQMSAMLGLSSAQVDALWKLAATL